MQHGATIVPDRHDLAEWAIPEIEDIGDDLNRGAKLNFEQQGITVLPVHDELVCPSESKDAVQQILIDSFHSVTQGKFSSHAPQMTWSEN